MPAGVSNAATARSGVLAGQWIQYLDSGGYLTAGITLKTVAAGKTFYLMGMGIHWVDNNGGGYATGKISGYAILEGGGGAANDTGTEIITFPIPLPIAATQTITCTPSDANTPYRVWAIGWEE